MRLYCEGGGLEAITFTSFRHFRMLSSEIASLKTTRDRVTVICSPFLSQLLPGEFFGTENSGGAAVTEDRPRQPIVLL